MIGIKDLLKGGRTLSIRYPWLMTALVLTALGSAGFEAVSMSLVIPLVDSIKGDSGTKSAFNFFGPLMADLHLVARIQMIALLLVVVTSLKGLFLYLYNLATTRLQVLVMMGFRNQCMDQLLKLSIGFINKERSSNLFTICTDYTKWTGTLVATSASILPKFFSSAILLVFLISISWKLTLASLFLILISSLVLRSVAEKANLSGGESNRETLKVNDTLLAATLGMKVVRIFNRENWIRNKFQEHVESHGRASLKNAMANASVTPIFEVTTMMTFGAILFLSSWFLASGGGNWLSALFIFIIILFRVVSPAAAINQARVTLAGISPAIQDLRAFLSTSDKHYIHSGHTPFQGLKDSIEFRGVEFRYDQNDEKVIDTLDFRIPKGSKIGIVGRSGAGKSTITELLLRFYDPQAGGVFVDGRNLADFDLATWRSHIGVVSQDTFLFNDTVRANIAFADPQASDEEVFKAAKLAHADEFIASLPLGYETQLGDRGVRLSGGQRQRIAIARAILKNPGILIFDEATSALDVESEKVVQQALNELGQGRTTIVIAHRLSTVVDADKIIVIHRGQLAEMGSHSELYAKKGIYFDLVESQLMSSSQP